MKRPHFVPASRLTQIATYFGGILLAGSAGFIGSVSTMDSVRNWYPTLVSPWFKPPNWVFGPVWTVLYIGIGVAMARLWLRRKDPEARFAAIVLAVHLVPNALWSILFFGVKNLGLALAEIALLWGMILFAILRAWRPDRIAAILLIPYLAWVSFATILNAAFWWLNR